MEITIEQAAPSRISVPFTVNDGKWTYQDILEFDSNAVPGDTELNQIIQDKFNTWKAYVETPKQ